MAKRIDSSLSKWELSAEEILRGSILHQEQKLWLQNERANICEQLLTLKIDPLNPMQIALEQAHLQGQLDFCTYLFNTAEISESEIKRLISAPFNI